MRVFISLKDLLFVHKYVLLMDDVRALETRHVLQHVFDVLRMETGNFVLRIALLFQTVNQNNQEKLYLCFLQQNRVFIFL